MKININNKVKVVLTDSGKAVYGQYLKQFAGNKNISQTVPQELTLPLWEFAQIFGSEMFMGNLHAPFSVNNEIEIIQN